MDVLAGLYRGGLGEKKNEAFKIFITKYLPHNQEYLSHDVWKHMRNGLVHAYSTKKFAYTDEHPERHLQKDSNGLLWIHVRSFIQEVEKAAATYLDDLSREDTLWQRFRDKWLEDPLLRPYQES